MNIIRKKDKPKKIKTQTETIYNPTTKIPEQQVITARNFYNMGMDAEFSSKQPGMPGRDTCQKLWRLWNTELRDSYQMDTNERQILAKQKMGESYKRLLFKLEIELNEYETAIDGDFKEWQRNTKHMEDAGNGDKVESYKPNDKHQRTRLAIIQAIIDCRDRMAALEITSTINERDELEILKYLQAKADRLAEIDTQFRDKESRLRNHTRE